MRRTSARRKGETPGEKPAALPDGQSPQSLAPQPGRQPLPARSDRDDRSESERAPTIRGAPHHLGPTRRSARPAPRRAATPRPSGRAALVRRDWASICRTTGRLHPNRQAWAPQRGWGRCGADRVTRRLSADRSSVRRGARPGSPFFQPAFTTRSERMQLVQTRSRCRRPSTSTWTRCRLGYHRRERLLLAWLTWLPNVGPLPQISQKRAMTGLSALRKVEQCKVAR